MVRHRHARPPATPLSIPMRAARTLFLGVGLTPLVMYLYFLGFGVLKGDTFLFQPKYPNLSRIDDVGCPVLFLHGTEDETIPLWHSQALYAKAAEPKWAVWIDGGHHDDLAWVGKDAYWKAWADFAARLQN